MVGLAIGIWFLLRYADRVKRDPAAWWSTTKADNEARFGATAGEGDVQALTPSTSDTGAPTRPARPGRGWAPNARLALVTIGVAQLVTVRVMPMTPVHMGHGGGELRKVGIVISYHTAGMYALSPVFGWRPDRPGRLPVLALGAGLLAIAGVVAGVAGAQNITMLSAGLLVLRLGWSAALVSGSALLVDAVPVANRPGAQGRTGRRPADHPSRFPRRVGGELPSIPRHAPSLSR